MSAGRAPHRASRPAAALGILLPACLALACAASPGGAGGDDGGDDVRHRPNLVLVVVDTLRADRLGVYGAERPTSPAVDRLASRAVTFTQARAQAPCTFPSVNSLLTSQPAWTFEGRPFRHLGIPSGLPTLASRLRRAGYGTAAVSASPVVRRSPGRLNREGGFGHGFDLFLEGCSERAAGCVNRRVGALLRLLPEPFFLYLHYFDPHDPYAAPASAPRRFARPYRGSAAVAAGDPLPAAERLYAGGGAGLSPRDLEHLRDRYDEEVVHADARLGELLALLDAGGRGERTAVVLTADHGESFLEHGHLRHCRSLHDEEVRVPLLVRPPGGVAARRVDRPVALLDVAPTLLEMAGVEVATAEPAPAGSSLLPELGGSVRDAEGAAAPVLSSAGAKRSLVAGRYKLIHDPAAGDRAARLYDLVADPGELHDLAAERPDETARLLALLDRRLAAVEGVGLGADDARDDATLRRLRALGYLR